MNMLPLDIVFGIIILIFAIRCALRGLVAEVMSWAAVAFGLLFAFLFYRRGAVLIRERFYSGEVLPEILAFAILFFIIFIIIKILEYVLRDIISRIKLGGIDRILGAVFGIMEGLLLVSLILLIITIQPLFDPAPVLAQSFFARFLSPFIGLIQDVFIRSQGISPPPPLPPPSPPSPGVPNV